MLAWWNKPGEWLLVIAAGFSLLLLWLDFRDSPERSGEDAGRGAAATQDEWWLRGMDPPPR